MARDETIKLSLVDGVTRSLASIQKGVGGVGAELAKLNQVSELAAKGFGLIGDAVDGISGSVQAVGNLEAALARVSDITGATAAEQVALQEAVNNAVSTLGVAADQAAGALVLMAEDGFSASEAVSSLNTVLAFAKANAQDAATATQALGGVLDTFGEKPAIIAQLADQLTAASRAAGVGTVTLQNGLAAIGVQAEQAGLGVSEATAALAALASRGIEGTQAAKQLGTVLTELNNPASAAGKALDEAGLKGKSFAEIVDVLSKDAAKAAPILEALGNRPRAALKVLLADGGGALREFNTIVAEAGNASAEAAAKVDETFVGALARLQATIDNLKNRFLEPILQPLADEFAAVSEKLNSLADSPQFARLRDQFETFATGAIQAVGRLIDNVNFEELAGDIAQFGSDSKAVFDDVILVAQSTAEAIRGISFAVKFLRGDAGLFSEAMDDATTGAAKLGAASGAAGGALDRLGANLADAKKGTRGVVVETDNAIDAFKTFAEIVLRAGVAAAKFADEIPVITSPSQQAREELIRLAGGAEQAAIGLERLRLATLSNAIAALARDGLQATGTFRALVAEVGKTEQSIAVMQAALDAASGSMGNQANAAENLRVKLLQLRGVQGDVVEGNNDIEDSSGSAADALSEIGNKSSSVEISLGNLTEAYVREALAAAGSAKSVRDYIRTLNGFFAAGADVENQIQARLDSLRKLNVVLSEEDQIRARLIQQYGNSSRLVEELVQQELRLAEAKKKTNDEAERGVQIEQRRLSGGLNFGAPSAPTAAGATGGRGSAQQGSGDRSAPQIVINVQGMTSDQARDFVTRSVVPELERINRLGR